MTTLNRPENLDERGLIEALRRGDDAAFEHVVRTHTGRMLAVARRILKHEEDAHDAVQDAFLSAVRNLASFSGKARLSTWLHRVVVNACLMTLRRRRVRPELLYGMVPEPASAGTTEPVMPVEKAEDARVVRDGIERLPETYRGVLKLRAIEGKSTREAARILRMTPDATKTRLCRAKRALKNEIRPLFGLASAG